MVKIRHFFELAFCLLLVCIAYFVTFEKRLYRLQQHCEESLNENYNKNIANEKEIRLLKTDVKKVEEIIYGGDYD